MEQDTHWRVSGVPSRPVTWASMNTWCPSNDVGATQVDTHAQGDLD